MYLFLLEAILCLVFTVILYYRYSAKNVPLYVDILVISVWYMTFLTALIVPFDIYTSIKIQEGGDYNLDSNVFQVLYIVLYWFIYILSWILIPLAQEYEAAGDFSVKDRMKRAIRRNIYSYIIFAVIGIGFIIYLVVNKKLTGEHLLGFLVALGNAWGIFLIVFLLGYGLVALPKDVLKVADYETRILYLQWRAADCKEHLMENNERFKEYSQKIKSTRSILEISDNNNPHRILVEKIWLDFNNFYVNLSNQDGIFEEELKQLNGKLSESELIELNQNIKRVKYDIIRLNCELEEIYKEWDYLQSISNDNITHLYDKTCFQRTYKKYYINLRPWLIRFFAFIIIIFSLATLLSEVTLFTNLPLSVFGMLVEQSQDIFILNILSLIPLIFLFCTSLYGLFSLRLSGYYAMHENKHTDSISLLFLSSFMCRIGFPLCLNFVQIMKIPNFKTILETLMGVTDLVPVLGKSFIIFYPTMLIVLCLFNIFDLYGKIMNFLGFSRFGFKSLYNDEKIEEGMEILHRMRASNSRDNINIMNKKDLNSNLIRSEDNNTKYFNKV